MSAGFDPGLWGHLRDWFNNLGWVANAIQILTPVVLIGGAGWKYRSHMFGHSTFAAIAEKHVIPKWSSASLRQFAEIAIVDDEPSDFPVAELRKAGYRIKTFKKINLDDFNSLLTFDVVFLDMYGIVRDDAAEGGLRLIGKLRAANPFQKICAVSSKTFDPTATAFFKQADDVQKKPMHSQRCQEVIDGFLSEKLEPVRLARMLDSQITGVSFVGRRLLLNEIKVLSATSKDPSSFAMPKKVEVEDKERFKYLLTDFIRVLRHASK